MSQGISTDELFGHRLTYPDVDVRERLARLGGLDDHHVLRAGMPMRVCGNTAAMLQDTRFRRHFRVVGDRSVHFGPFDCSPAPAACAPAGDDCC